MKKIIVVLVTLFFFLLLFFFTNLKISSDLFLLVKEGDSINIIGDKLKKEGFIFNKKLFKTSFKLYSIINGCGIVHIGEYNFINGERYWNIFDKVCNGKSIMKTITIPEGFETREIISLLNNNKDFVGNKIVFFEEGKLLPESYNFKSGTKRDEVFEKMKSDFNDFINNEWDKRDIYKEIKTKEDAIILASIVEKEAKTDNERPIIASVYLNRLKINMRLESDPTVIYEITKGRYKMGRLLNRKDLLKKGDYNTYRKRGLPIAPICNPGKKSILAALHPSKTTYLYFVSKEDLSGHYFSENYKEHLQNIKFVKKKISERKRIKQ